MNELALVPSGLAAHGIEATPTALVIPPGLRFNDWKRLIESLEGAISTNLWWIADAWAYGEQSFRREYGPALDSLHARGTVYNMGSVARRVETSRRREVLSFSHHVEVAPLEPDWQTVWLDDAETHAWSRNELRDRIAAWKHARSGTEQQRASWLVVRVQPALGELCARAATVAGITPAEWAAGVLERAARATLAEAA